MRQALFAMLALNFPTPPGYTKIPAPPITNANQIGTSADIIKLWIFYGLLVVSVVMVLVAGYRYATSAGEPEKVQTANKTLLYAVVALLVAFTAYGLVSFVKSFFR